MKEDFIKSKEDIILSSSEDKAIVEGNMNNKKVEENTEDCSNNNILELDSTNDKISINDSHISSNNSEWKMI